MGWIGGLGLEHISKGGGPKLWKRYADVILERSLDENHLIQIKISKEISPVDEQFAPVFHIAEVSSQRQVRKEGIEWHHQQDMADHTEEQPVETT